MTPYLKKFDVRQINLIMGGLLTLAIIATMTYLINPQFKEYQNANKIHTQLKHTILKDRQIIDNLRNEKNTATPLAKKLYRDLESLPLNQIEAYIIGKLQQISWQHNIELAGIKPSFSQRPDSFQEIEFKINVSGDYFDIYAWVTSLNKEFYFTVFKQFEMRPLEQSKMVPRLQANLIMVAYLNAKN